MTIGCGSPSPGVSRAGTDAAAPARDADRVAGDPLRVCADPNNLPFTNSREEGFENRIAELLADDLGTRVEYVWWAQRRGFLRNTLNAGTCDVVMGLPTSVEMALTTDPYYRSTYVFVSRRDRHLRIRSLTMPG
jgi:ABC-type amino acid transport substrate-binding protein